MGSWLRKLSVSQAVQVSNPAARLGVNDVQSAPRWEPLENRVFLSAAPLDVTNTYAGMITFKLGKTKLKEVIGVSLGYQCTTGFVTGTVTTDHFGSVNVAGQLNGKKLKLVGTNHGGLLQVKVGKKGAA